MLYLRVFTFFLLSCFLFKVDSSAQLSAYHGIITPYDSRVYSLAQLLPVPENLTDPLINPAGLSFLQKPELFFSFFQKNTKARADLEYPQKSVFQSTYSELHPDIIHAAYSLKWRQTKFTINLSLHYIAKPEVEIQTPEEIDPSMEMRHSQDGNIWNATLGIGARLGRTFAMGISWSRWFGSWSWKDEFSKTDFSGSATYRYGANIFSAGIVKRLGKFAIGFTLHSPAIFMKANNVLLKTWYLKTVHRLNQNSGGAVHSGIQYKPNKDITFFTGYRFQKQFSIQNEFIDPVSEKTEDRYSASHQLSLGAKYRFNFHRFIVPVFVLYQANWLPKTKIHYWDGYQIISKEDNKQRNSFMVGTEAGTQKLHFFVTGQYENDSFHITNQTTPPYS